MSVFSKQLRIRNTDVDHNRRLRLSTMTAMFQEISMAHTESLGLDRTQTLDRGLLWVITLQSMVIHRLPVYDERVTLETWTGRTTYVFFPRYYRICAEDGSVLVEASSFWGLMDQTARKLVFPEERNIVIPAEKTGNEPPLPRVPKGVSCTQTLRFTVPYSYLDLNGHMNNTRYFDLALDLLPEKAHENVPCRVVTEYSGEALFGQELQIGVGTLPDGYYLCGEADRRIFRMELHYPTDEE